MIVQHAGAGAEHFVITMQQHTALSGLFAAHFGNRQFEPIAPRDLMLHVITHHDVGWTELDAQALRDPATGLPYNLVQTPFELIVETSVKSANINGERHPYCGLMSSMHSWGLYNGRYGMSDKVLLDSLADANRALADRMLAGEVARQKRLQEELAGSPDTAAWVEQAHLFQNYKQLQFFDTLALYFNCQPEGMRERSLFSHVPLNSSTDTIVTVEPLAPGVYGFDPFPFDDIDLEITFAGRYMTPVSAGETVREVLDQAPVALQSVRVVPLSA